MKRPSETIALDDVPTWPQPVLDCLREHQDDLERLVEVLTPFRFAGYHATRLCVVEVDAIRRDGMSPHTEEFRQERIRRCIAAGDIPRDFGDELLAKGPDPADWAYQRRTPAIHFTFVRSDLRDEAGMHRFFRVWGGEVICRRYEGRGGVPNEPRLMKIGSPKIVVAELAIAQLNEDWESIARHLVRRFHDPSGHSGFEGWVACLAPGEIVDVIDFADARFDDLTQHRNWREPLDRIP